jgi:DNA-binding NarL/FixJ family response regulator
MRLFMRGSVEKGLKDFEDGLEQYFATSRRYRSNIRRGSIVLLDDDDSMFKLFMFLVDKCGLDVGVVHVNKASSAKKAVQDIGAYNVKAVVIDENMLGKSMNGDSFPSWLAKSNPRIPVWVVNCEEERREWIRSQSIKIGILNKEATLSSVVEAVGFPSECQAFVSEFAN